MGLVNVVVTCIRRAMIAALGLLFYEEPHRERPDGGTLCIKELGVREGSSFKEARKRCPTLPGRGIVYSFPPCAKMVILLCWRTQRDRGAVASCLKLQQTAWMTSSPSVAIVSTCKKVFYYREEGLGEG